jgi:hypothetical protein
MPDLTQDHIDAIIENGKGKHFRTFMEHMDEV